MQGYAATTPIDRNGNVTPLTAPAGPALQSNGSGVPTSSLITLAPNTTMIQITTLSFPAVGKWFGAGAGNPSVTASSFDFSIPANWTNYQVVPQSVQGIGGIGSIVGGYGAREGLYPSLALIPIGGTGSILSSQY